MARTQTTEAERSGPLWAWEASGLSARAYGGRGGINPNTLVGWRWQRQSGLPFGLSMVLRRAALERMSGEVRDVCVTLADGRHKTSSRCSECGVEVWGDFLSIFTDFSAAP